MAYDANKIKYDFFTFDGAISKAEYQRSFLILFAIGIILTALTYTIPLPSIFITVLLIIRIVLLVAMFSICMRRLRDLGQTPWLSLLLFVPLVNLIFMVYLLIADKKTIL